nr:glycosyltransferase 87 family protein [uncultured Actinoplanes sp.]
MVKRAWVTLACLGAAWAIGFSLQRYGVGALAVDHAAVRDWLLGNDLYAYRSPATRLGTDATPVAAILLVPLVFLPLTIAGCLLGATGVAALILAVVALVGPVARRYGRRRTIAVAAAVTLALVAEPVRSALGLGTLDLILFGLVTADIVALRRASWARSRAAWWPGPPASQPQRADVVRRGWATGAWAGAGTGIATALSPASLVFVLYLAVTRQWRAFTTAVSTAFALYTVAFVIAPDASATWFGTVVPQADRAGPVDATGNQSLAGVLSRLYDPAGTPVLVWLAFAVLLVAVGMIRARAAHTEGDEITGFTLAGLAGAAVGPVSVVHEMVWLLPAVLILVDAAARKRVTGRRPRPRRLAGAEYACAAVLVTLLVTAGPVWTIGWNGYALALILLVNTLPWRPAVPTGRPARPVRRVPAIPGPRGS